MNFITQWPISTVVIQQQRLMLNCMATAEVPGDNQTIHKQSLDYFSFFKLTYFSSSFLSAFYPPMMHSPKCTISSSLFVFFCKWSPPRYTHLNTCFSFLPQITLGKSHLSALILCWPVLAKYWSILICIYTRNSEAIHIHFMDWFSNL